MPLRAWSVRLVFSTWKLLELPELGIHCGELEIRAEGKDNTDLKVLDWSAVILIKICWKRSIHLCIFNPVLTVLEMNFN